MWLEFDQLTPPLLPMRRRCVAASCTDCQGSSAGTRRIYPGKTGSYYSSPTCTASPVSSLSACTFFFYAGTRQAIDCGGTRRCFAQIQLPASGGGPTYWLLDHNCGDGQTVIVDADNAQCGGGECAPCRAAGGWAARQDASWPHGHAAPRHGAVRWLRVPAAPPWDHLPCRAPPPPPAAVSC